MRILGIVVGLVVMLIGCSNGDIKNKNSEFSSLYNTLIQDLKDSDVKLKKYIKKGDKSDTIVVDTVNWTNELKMFIDAEISRSVYNDYEINTSKDGCEKYFQTKMNKHVVKNYHYVNCENDLIVYIDVKKMSGLYEFNYHLELNKEGYLIQAYSNVEFAYESNYRIEGKFYEKEK